VSGLKPYFKDWKILAVDDEVDVLDTIEDLMDGARVDKALDRRTALSKMEDAHYDLAILDIMGVDGMSLLEEAVERGIPAVMLTANAEAPETLQESIRKGALGYLPKAQLADLDVFLAEIMEAHRDGRSTWSLILHRLEDYFAHRFGYSWQEKDPDFWIKYGRRRD
jgi:CheY-like chemotaxis protein